MPPCVCGLKVDRNTTSLQCIQCNGLFHLDCCNVAPNDLDLIKNSYKCANCIRRGSSLQDKDIILTAINAMSDDVVGAKVSCPPKTVAVDVVGANASGSPSIAAVDDVVASDNIATSDLSGDVSEIGVNSSNNALFALLLKEVRSLRTSNDELKALVSSLSEQNAILLAKFDAFETSLGVAGFNVNGAVNSSPKRKKKKKNLGDNPTWQSDMDSTSHHTATTMPINFATDSDASTAAPTAPTFASLLRSSTGAQLPSTAAVVSNHVIAQPDWTQVGKTRKLKNNLIGTGANNEIGVISNFKWLHLSSFNNTVTEANIIDYIAKTSNISSTNFACYKLVKKTDDISKLKFINFKLGIVSDFYNAILSPALWPANVRVRPFIFSEKKTVPTAGTFLEQQMEQPPVPSEQTTQVTV